jgi:glutathione S-transferase
VLRSFLNETITARVTRQEAEAGSLRRIALRDTNIVLYQAEWCPYCANVRSKLTELLLDYKNVNVPRSHSERTVVKEVSGQTGIPVMVDGDVIIADDDDAINEYLEKKYGKTKAG